MCKILKYLCVCLVAFVIQQNSVEARIHGLIVGIDNYEGSRPLKGAVNDAKDLEKVLLTLAPGRVQTLINEAATRSNFIAAWKEIIESTRSNDTIIVSFAGHGAQIADTNAFIDEADGSDEVLLFQPFDEHNNDGELLLDDEIFDYFRQAEEKGVAVIFVVDACHSGGVVRSVADVNIESAGLPFRFTRFKTKKSKTSVPVDLKPAHPKLPASSLFIGATHENLKVQEILIRDTPTTEPRPRGALSYVMARALEGCADLDRDGTITSRELEHYVTISVREASQNRQIPEVIAERVETRLIDVVDNCGSKLKLPNLSKLTVFSNSDNVLSSLIGIERVSSVDEAELIWKTEYSQLLNSSGDVIANNIRLHNIQAAIDGNRIKNLLLKMSRQARTMAIDLKPDDRLHSYGCKISFAISELNFPHLTIFNISGDGTFQFLYPLDQDQYYRPLDQPWDINLVVTPPFGSDTLVAVASREPLHQMNAKLRQLDSLKSVIEIQDILGSELVKSDYQIGIKSVYTSKNAAKHSEVHCY